MIDLPLAGWFVVVVALTAGVMAADSVADLIRSRRRRTEQRQAQPRDGWPMTGWAGHPWAAAEHHTLGGRASCSGCLQICTPTAGCWCCSEPAWEWLTAEARWWATQCRIELADILTDMLRRSFDRAIPWDGPANYPYPWEPS